MSTGNHSLLDWLADYYIFATALLLVALLVGVLIRQPAKRYLVTAGAIVGLAFLAVLCASPLWPRLVFMGRTTSTIAAGPLEVSATPIVEPLVGQMPVVSGPPLVGSAKPQAATMLRPNHPVNSQEIGHIQNQTSARIDFPSLVAAIFILGASIVSIWLAIGALRARRLCRLAQPAPDFALQELENISLSLGERAGTPQATRRGEVREFRIPQLLISHLIDIAAASGLLRPTILLPASTLAEIAPSPDRGDFVPGVGTGAKRRRSSHHTLTPSPAHALAPRSSPLVPASFRMLLAHEWAHICRGDLWLLAASRLLLVVLFAHPLYWLLRRRLRFDQELLADALAAQLCGRQQYAETLLAWARRLPDRRLSPGGALGIWNRPGQLSRRIAMLLDERIRLQGACSRFWKINITALVMSLVTGLSLVTIRPVPIANADAPAQPATQAVSPAKRTESATDTVNTLKPDKVVTVAGTCLDEKHQPVANAHVRLFRIDHSDYFDLKPSGRMKWVQTTIPGADADNGAVLTSGSVSGTQRLLKETRTDAEGRFQFADLTADEDWRSQKDTLWVVVQAPGKATESDRPIISHNSEKQWVDPLKFTLQGATVLRGRITNTEGQPVAGATISCSLSNYLVEPVPGIECAITDADGRYEIDDLAPFDANDYPPQVTPFGALAMVSTVATVDHPDYAQGIIEYTKTPSTIDHVLARPTNLHGQVVLDENGRPADETRVNWTHENGLSWGVRTDGQGNYSLPRLLPGKYKIEAIRQDRLTASREITLDPGEHTLDLRLKRGGHIQGKVVDDTTGKVPTFDRSMSIEVAVHNVHTIENGQMTGSACQGWVNEDGSFSVTVVPGHSLLSFGNPNWEFANPQKWNQNGIDVADGQTVEVELRLKPRRGGWTAVSAELATVAATAKGDPAPPPLRDSVEPSIHLGDSGEDALFKSFLEWPDELLPKQPLSEKAVLRMLEQPNLGSIERKTIDGEEQIVTIYLGDCGPFFQAYGVGQLLWLEYGVLAHIDAFPHLETLGMMGGPGDDAWLEPLRGNKTLKSVMLGYSKNLTAAGLEHLVTLPNLEGLVAFGWKLDDRALHVIATFPKLEMLQFGGAFTDAGVRELRSKMGLKQLGLAALDDARLTDQCLGDIGTLKNLEGLGIMGFDEADPRQSQITDAGLAQLAELTKLESLTLSCPQITNAGLVHLRELKQLKHLDVKGTAVTQAGIDELKKSLPRLVATGYQGWKPALPTNADKPREAGEEHAPKLN